MAFSFKDLSILLVDDDVSVREMTSAILKSFKFKNVDAVESAEEALILFNEKKHDLIMTDWELPGMDGIDLIKAIRTDEASQSVREVPIILASGYTNGEMIKAARDAGTTEFIIKPFSADDLAKRIAYVLNNKRPFIKKDAYIGPDRRRIHKEFEGQDRREGDDER